MEFFSVFITGCIAGYLMELFYKRLTLKKWKNPGFLKGPYLPLYGFGAVIIYLVCSLNINFIIRFFMFLILLSLLEYITGLIFIKKLGYKFWDYSSQKFNINGLICPLFSFIWAIIGSAFYYAVYPFFQFATSKYFVLITSLILGIIAVDFIFTFYKLIVKRIRRTKKMRLSMDKK